MVKFNFNLAPKDAIKYLRNKGYKLSFDYNELQKQAHYKAFTVAKVTRLDLLHDIFNSIDKAMIEGQNFKEWKKNIKPTLEAKGWWGEKEITNPKTGEIKTIKVDERRLRNIYKTNMRVSYAQARYKEQIKLPLSQYFIYKSALLENTRVEHEALHNTVLPRDDVFWSTNYPPNGWGCVCHVLAISEKEAKKRGYKILKTAPKSIASKDWNYNPATQEKIAKVSKLNLDDSLEKLPLLKTIKKDEYKNLSEDELHKKFYKTLGTSEGSLMIDKVNDPIFIDNSLFSTSLGDTKIKKQNRHIYLDEIAKTIKDPDEIYLEYERLKDKKGRLVKKYFKYYKNDNGAKKALIVLFEYLKDKTQGVSAYFNSSGTVEKKRFEKLIYQRDQGKN
ncbi:phage minor head protein [Malaciobacter marinus]|uniref:phage minor head protein n=1 Tax=Malaciobacter marinus TaxID=505249 RepID=UPI003AFF710C